MSRIIIRREDVDTIEEVQEMFQRVFDNLCVMEAKIEDIVNPVEQKTETVEVKKNNKGFVRTALLVILCLMFLGVVYAEPINPTSTTIYSWDSLLDYLHRPQAGFTQIKIGSATYTVPTADGSNGQVLKTNGSGTLSWAANGGGVTDLDTAYNGGQTITADTNTITITGDTAFNKAMLALYANDTNDPNTLYIKQGTGNTGYAILIDSQTNGTDIKGNHWNINEAGLLTSVGVTSSGLITGTLGATITGAVANINASSNFATNIGTGTTTSTVTLGGTNNAVVIAANGSGTVSGVKKVVTDDADGRTLTALESGNVITNTGAGNAYAYTLPTAVAGLEFYFVVGAVQDLRVTPASGDKINHAGTLADAAEYYFANAIGESLHVIAIDDTQWVVISETGTWAEQSP